MKKFLSFFAAVLFAGSMMAANYELVTSVDKLEAGAKYIIGSADTNEAVFMGTKENKNNRVQSPSFAITEGQVTVTDTVLVLELGADDNGAWVFKTTNYHGTDGFLSNASSGTTNACYVQADSMSFTISFEGNKAVITSKGGNDRKLMRYNSGSKCFACYASGQKDLYLYKEAASAPALADGYYLVGNFNDWTADANYLLVENTAATAGGEYMIDTVFNQYDSLKVIQVKAGSDPVWYPGGANYVIPAAGSYTIYFRPNYQGGDDWHEKCIYAAAKTTPVEPVVTFALNNNWGGAQEWSEKELVYDETTTAYYLSDVVFGGTGVDLIKKEDGKQVDKKWYPIDKIKGMEVTGAPMDLMALDTVSFYFSVVDGDTTFEAMITGPVARQVEPPTDYYLVGNFNGWDPQADYALEENAAAAGEYMIKNVKLAKDDSIKVVGVTEGQQGYDWFPRNADNYVIAESGVYDIYFRPDYQGGQDWYAQCLYVAKQQTPVIPENIWRVTADTKVEANTAYIDNEGLKLSTVFGTTLKNNVRTIAGIEFGGAIQVRVKDNPTATVPTGTENSGSTPLVLEAKKDVNIILYYNRQTVVDGEILGTENDSKDLIVFDQADLSKLTGTFTIDAVADDKNQYINVTKALSLQKGHTYTLAAKGTTLQLHGMAYEILSEPELKYYLKNNWDGAADWTWKEMTKVEEGMYLLENVVFGGTGVNFATSTDAADPEYIPVADFNGEEVGALDTVGLMLILTGTKPSISVDVIGKYQRPESEVKFYLKNNWNGAQDWTEKEMTYMVFDDVDQYRLDAVFGGQGVNLIKKVDGKEVLNRWYPVEELYTFFENDNAAELLLLDTVTFIFDDMMVDGTPDTVMAAMITGPVARPEYYLVGNHHGNWAPTAEYKLSQRPGDAHEFFIENVRFAESDSIKVVKVFNGQTEWYPANAGNLVIGLAGTYDLTFRPNMDGKEGWYEKCIYITSPEVEKIKLYVVNRLNWQQVYVYVYSTWGAGALQTWPGILLTDLVSGKQVPSRYAQDQVLEFEIPKYYDMIVFNNGKEGTEAAQTIDLTWKAEEPYFLLEGEKNSEGKYEGEWAKTPTDIDAINAETTAIKVLQNGQIFILKAGHVYNVTGQIVK